MMKIIFLRIAVIFSLLLITVNSLYGKAVVKKTDNQQVLLENSFLKINISPMGGGRIISFIDKKSGFDYTKADSDLGMFCDLLWQQSFKSGDWLKQVYKYDIFNDKDKAYIVLSASGKSQSFKWITIKKTFILYNNSPKLDVKHEYHVDQEAMRAITICPWFHNGIFVKKHVGKMYFPTTFGVKTIDYNSLSPVNESFHYDITDGWLAYLIPAKKTGLAITMDYKTLMCFYNWQGPNGNSMEWMYRSQKVKNGSSLKLNTSLMPFKGFSGICGIAPGFVGNITKDTIELNVADCKKIKICLTQNKLPAVLGSVVMEKELSLDAGKTVKIPFSFSPETDGTYVLRCQIRSLDDKKLFAFEKAIINGKSSAKYVVNEKLKRAGSAQERFGMKILNLEERQDYYSWNNFPKVKGTKWCKPYTGGKIKMLAVIDMRNGREAIEVAERMDADLSVCTFASAGKCNWHPVWGHASGKTEINAYLSELLKKNYDCILMGGMQIDSISKENMKNIAAKVRGGTGLVTVLPTKIPEQFADIFPAKPLLQESYKKIEKALFKSSSMKIEKDSFLKAFPFKAMPELYFFPYEAKGETVVSVDKKPFLTLGNAQKGRLALFTWLVGRPDNTRHCGLNPYFDEKPNFDWHEYFYGMLIKAVRWASHRSPSIILDKAELKSDVLCMEVNSNNKKAFKVCAELEFKNKMSENVKSMKHNFIAKPGKNLVNIPVNYSKLNGSNFVNIKLVTQGLISDFGAAEYQYKAPAAIEKISFTDKIYKEGESIPVEVFIRGKADVSGKLIDNFGREIAIAKVQPQGNGKFKLEFVLKHLYANAAEVKVYLKNGSKLYDKDDKEVLLAPASLLAKKWDDFTILMAWPRRAGRGFPLFLHELRRDAMRKIGISTVLHTGQPVKWGFDEDRFRLTYRQGFALIMESVARITKKLTKNYPYPSFDFCFNKSRLKWAIAGYAKTRDKKFLHRNPSLEDEKYRQVYKKFLLEHIKKLKEWNPKVYDFGDEISYILYAKEIDFDFSPVALEKFRKWLKTQYPSLQALNDEWGSNFKSWDAVIPETSDEARKRNKFASWCDHRTYIEKVTSDFYKLTASVIKTADPQARISLSGTQPPRPYNGYNWSLLMPIFDTLSAYSSSGMPEIFSSFKKIPMIGWVCYGVPTNNLWFGVWKNIFNGHYGVALYNEDVLLNPDMSLAQNGSDLLEILAPLRKGLGKLLYNSKSSTPLVGIHYSQQSIRAAWIKQEFGKFTRTRVGWINLLKDLKLPGQFIDSKAVENGELLKRKYKAFVLPWSMALSDKLINALEDYLKMGGVILIDKEPGIRNEHCSEMPVKRMKAILSNPNTLLLKQLPDQYIAGQKKSTLRDKVKTFLAEHKIEAANKIFKESNDYINTSYWHMGAEGIIAGLLSINNVERVINRQKNMTYYDLINSGINNNDRTFTKFILKA
jgi:hypothetical protein